VRRLGAEALFGSRARAVEATSICLASRRRETTECGGPPSPKVLRKQPPRGCSYEGHQGSAGRLFPVPQSMSFDHAAPHPAMRKARLDAVAAEVRLGRGRMSS
jgi:hypothetical protein